MSTAHPTVHPLIARFREEVQAEEFLTQAEIADQLGVSLRTVADWLHADVTPQKRQRRRLADWLDSREGEAA